MTVYIVTQGEYSDYQIVGVYDDEDLAKAFAATLNERDDARVEPWEMNQHQNELKSGRIPFSVHSYDYHGKLRFSVEAFSENFKHGLTVSRIKSYSDDYFRYMVGVYAKDRDGALKVAMEKVTQWKALKQSLFEWQEGEERVIEEVLPEN